MYIDLREDTGLRKYNCIIINISMGVTITMYLILSHCEQL